MLLCFVRAWNIPRKQKHLHKRPLTIISAFHQNGQRSKSERQEICPFPFGLVPISNTLSLSQF